MSGREPCDEFFGQQPPPILVMRAPPSWTVIGFLGALGALHLAIWGVAMAQHHAEAFLSLVFGVGFLIASLAAYLTCHEIVVLPAERCVRLRTGYRRVRTQRDIPFDDVVGVRLTLTPDPDHKSGRVELVCRGESIVCPPTRVARQEALCLAITLGVRLTKVTGDTPATRPWRRRKLERV